MGKHDQAEHAHNVRLRQLGAAFLFAAVAMVLFSFIGIRGTRRQEGVNQSALRSFERIQDLRLAINTLELQLTLAEREAKANGFVSSTTVRICKALVPPIVERFGELSGPGNLLEGYTEYNQFSLLLQRLSLQVAILELEGSDFTVQRTVESANRLRMLSLKLNDRLEENVSQQARSANNLGLVSMGVIVGVFALLVLFTLSIMVTPSFGPSSAKRSGNVYYLDSYEQFRRQNPK